MTKAIQYSDNAKKFIKELGKVHGEIEQAAAETLNEGAETIEGWYKRRLGKEFILRNKYTLGAIRILKAMFRRKSGEIRPMHKINAVVGVRKMKGGREHYLLDQEEGGVRRGSTKTENRVPIPLAAARTSESERKPVARPYRLNTGQPQEVRVGGRVIGRPGDGWGPAQRWAILHRLKNAGSVDMKKPFFFIALNKGFGVFTLKGSRIRMIRNLEETSVRIRGRKQFEGSVKSMTPGYMDSLFLKNVKKRVRK